MKIMHLIENVAWSINNVNIEKYYKPYVLKVVLPICEIFRTKKFNCLTIIQKQKVFISELSLNNSKIFA